MAGAFNLFAASLISGSTSFPHGFNLPTAANCPPSTSTFSEVSYSIANVTVLPVWSGRLILEALRFKDPDLPVFYQTYSVRQEVGSLLLRVDDFYNHTDLQEGISAQDN